MFCFFQRKMFTESGSNLQWGASRQRRAKRNQQWARSCLCASAWNKYVSKLVLTSLCQGLCWLCLMHLEGEVTQYSQPPASQMHFTAFKPSHYLISAARSHLVCADIIWSGFLHFLTETMTHSSKNRHLMPRNRQCNSGPQMGLNNLFLMQPHFYNFWKNAFETKTSIHRFSFHRVLVLKTYSIISSWKIKYLRMCFPDNIITILW